MKKKKEIFRSIFLTEQINDRPVFRNGCPTPEEIIQSFDPQTTIEFKKKIIDHISHCPACQREFELIKNSYQLVKEIEDKILRKRNITHFCRQIKLAISSFFFSRKLVTASLIILFSILGLYILINYQRNLETRRGEINLRQADLIEEIKLSGEPSIKLRWNPVNSALFYRIEIFDENMELIWESPSQTETILNLPDNLVNIIKNKKFFFWQLITYLNDKRFIESQVKKAKIQNQ